jgi:fructose-1,6-bisphosphatase/inositol monophosphatase family enzyme
VAAAALIVAEAGGVVTAADGSSLDACPAIGSGDGFGLAVVASASHPLHDQLLDAVGQGMVRLRTHLAHARAVH